jgi:hypothetical protein
MTEQRKIELKTNAMLAMSIGTFLTVVGGVYVLGQRSQQLSSYLGQTVQVRDMRYWINETVARCPEWKPADFEAIHERNHRKPVY